MLCQFKNFFGVFCRVYIWLYYRIVVNSSYRDRSLFFGTSKFIFSMEIEAYVWELAWILALLI